MLVNKKWEPQTFSDLMQIQNPPVEPWHDLASQQHISVALSSKISLAP